MSANSIREAFLAKMKTQREPCDFYLVNGASLRSLFVFGCDDECVRVGKSDDKSFVVNHANVVSYVPADVGRDFKADKRRNAEV